MSEFNFRNLRADELEVRVSDKKDGRMSLLVFKDSRVDMRVLDETVGNENWSVQYKREGDTLFAGIGIYSKVHNAFIYKWSAGAPSNFEAIKGEASDAFKRAGFMWGIGRSLYTCPKISVPESNAKFHVSVIDYDANGYISDLEIRDWNEEVVFLMAEGQVIRQDRKKEVDRAEVLRIFCGEQKKVEGVDTKKLLKFYEYYLERVDDFDNFNAKIAAKLWSKWNSK